MSILNDIRSEIRESTSSAAAATRPSDTEGRKKSLLWLNVGVVLPGAGKDGADEFVSLPFGLPLDDMKPTEARGSNQNWVNLVQAKNAFLESVKRAGAKMKPGQSEFLPELTVQLHRVSEPSNKGSASNNDMIAALEAVLKGNL